MSSNDPIIPWFPDEKKRKAGDIHGKAKLPLTCCKGVHQEHITQRNYEVAKDCLLGHTNGTAYTQASSDVHKTLCDMQHVLYGQLLKERKNRTPQLCQSEYSYGGVTGHSY